MEFQVRGITHVHFYIWILNASHLPRDNKPLYTESLNVIIGADPPEEDKEQELFDVRKNFQTYRHTNTYHKFKNKRCRFHYGRYLTDRTVIAEPLASNTAVDVKVILVEKRNRVLDKVK